MTTSGIHELAALMRRSAKTVILTGAGMSTESGLPDWRGSDGLYHSERFGTLDIHDLACLDGFYRHFPEYVDFYRWRIQAVLKHEPHDGHRVLARLQERGLIQGLITQNVDGYHQRAGSTNVQELHGSIRILRCQRCKTEVMAEYYLVDHGVHCPCLANFRPGVVMFGEHLPPAALATSAQMADEAALMIVLGSSLQVHPASSLPGRTLQHGGRLAIINNEQTPYHEQADVVIHGAIGGTLMALEAALIT